MGASALFVAGRARRPRRRGGAGPAPVERGGHPVHRGIDRPRTDAHAAGGHRGAALASDPDRGSRSGSRGSRRESRASHRGSRRFRGSHRGSHRSSRDHRCSRGVRGHRRSCGLVDFGVDGRTAGQRDEDRAVALRDVAGGRQPSEPAAPDRLAVGPAHAVARHEARARSVAGHGAAAVAPAASASRGRTARVGGGRSANGDRVAQTRGAAARERARGSRPASDGSDSRARARAHPAARLSREPAADARRDAPLLPSGRLVDLAPDPYRARALLRRSRGEPLRRSGRLRARACRPRNAPRRAPRGGRKRRLARGPHRKAPRCAGLARGKGPGVARRDRRRRPRVRHHRRDRGSRRSRGSARIGAVDAGDGRPASAVHGTRDPDNRRSGASRNPRGDDGRRIGRPYGRSTAGAPGTARATGPPGPSGAVVIRDARATGTACAARGAGASRTARAPRAAGAGCEHAQQRFARQLDLVQQRRKAGGGLRRLRRVHGRRCGCQGDFAGRTRPHLRSGADRPTHG